MRTNHRIATRTTAEVRLVQALEVATTILEEALGVEVCLQAQRQAGWAGADAWHAGMYCHESRDDERLVKVNFRNLEGRSTYEVLQVLGHEMRHALQHKNGWFDQYRRWVGPAVEYTGVRTKDLRYRAWFSKPQEVDARNFEKTYADLVINDPRFTPFRTALDIPGTILMKKDYVATYAALGVDFNDEVARATVRILRLRDESLCWVKLSQTNGKKWTPKLVQAQFQRTDLLAAQPLVYVMTPVTLDDLVS